LTARPTPAIMTACGVTCRCLSHRVGAKLDEGELPVARARVRDQRVRDVLQVGALRQLEPQQLLGWTGGRASSPIELSYGIQVGAAS
jgi:hypothetical protein